MRRRACEGRCTDGSDRQRKPPECAGHLDSGGRRCHRRHQAFLDAHAASQANGEALLVDIKAATTVDDATAAVEANTDIDTLDITGKEAAAAVGLTECAKD